MRKFRKANEDESQEEVGDLIYNLLYKVVVGTTAYLHVVPTS